MVKSVRTGQLLVTTTKVNYSTGCGGNETLKPGLIVQAKETVKNAKDYHSIRVVTERTGTINIRVSDLRTLEGKEKFFAKERYRGARLAYVN